MLCASHLLHRLLSDKTHTYAYDAENRIIQVDAGATATYSYDADGRRAVKTTGSSIYNECDPSNTTGGTVYYIYDLAGHSAVYTANGVNGCKDEIYAGARHLATYEGRTTFIHTDWLGTDRVHIAYPSANNRSLDQHCTSLPFGDGASGCVATPYTSPLFFTGKERDSESGLDNFKARYDSSSLGRFMSPDPANYGAIDESPQTWNAYSYVANNPLNATDPDGLDCVYTQNFSKTGEVTVERGNCTQKGGTYVDGTIDTKSLTYNSKTNELGFTFSNAEQQTGGAGTLSLGPPPNPVSYTHLTLPTTPYV